MTQKPECSCWKDPQIAAGREQQVDGMAHAIQISVDQAARDLNLCDAASSYVGGAVMAGIVFWVAYMRRGDGEAPTTEQVAAAEAEVIALSRARLEGARMQDMDLVQSPTDAVH